MIIGDGSGSLLPERHLQRPQDGLDVWPRRRSHPHLPTSELHHRGLRGGRCQI